MKEPFIATVLEQGSHLKTRLRSGMKFTAAWSALLLLAGSVHGQVLTFEGLQDAEQVQNFYNGGTGGNGSGPGSNFGVSFSTNALALIDTDNGGAGNFANEPSASTIVFFQLGGSVVMNVPAGFINGFSFFYTSIISAGTVFVYDGLNAAGNQLTSLNLVALGTDPLGGDPSGSFNRWQAVGVTFAGIARSVDFGGAAGAIGFDDITLGSAVPGVLAPPAEAGGFRRQDEPDPYLLIDTGAINSLLTTGLLIPQVHRNALQNAASNATRDLNSRLFRARTEAIFRDGFESGNTSAWSGLHSSLDSSTLRYLNFAAAQKMDYRVALGLRDGVEVEYRDDSMALGDTFWATSPFAMSGGPVILAAAPHFTGAVIAAPAGVNGGGKEVFEDKVVIGEPAGKRWETFAEFDYGFYDQDTLTNLVRGFDSDIYAGSVGVEYRVFPWLHAGLALTKLESDTEISSNLGGIDMDGTVLSGYFTAFHKRTYLDVLYSYGAFDSDISRNTLLGSTAHGDAESFSHNIDINVGHNYALSDQIVAGPYAGFNYSNGGVDGYTERGGGNANIVYPADDFESMIGRLGWQLSYTTETPVGRVTAQGRAAWAHQFMPESDSVQASLATSPFILVSGNHAARVGGFGAEGPGAHAGTDWLELGAGLRLHLDESWNVQLDYEGQFARNNASAHFAALKLEYEWDDVFLPGLGGKDVVAGEPKAKGAGLKGLFAGKTAEAAERAGEPVALVAAPEVNQNDTTPFAEAKPVAAVAPAPPTRSAPASSANTEDKPKIYNSWDEVPGRENRMKTTPLPKAAAAEPVQAPVAVPVKAEVGKEAEAAPAEVKTGAVSEPVASAN